jgi:hypothetical protein
LNAYKGTKNSQPEMEKACFDSTFHALSPGDCKSVDPTFRPSTRLLETANGGGFEGLRHIPFLLVHSWSYFPFKDLFPSVEIVS